MPKSFIWAVDKTPDWFSGDTSYRMNPATGQIEIPTRDGNVLASPGDRITQDGEVFNVAQSSEPIQDEPEARLIVQALTVTFDDGSQIDLDTSKILIIDKQTKKPLFDVVLQKDV